MRTPIQLSCKNQLPTEKPSCGKPLPMEDWCPAPCGQQTTKWKWCWAGILWTQSLFAGLEAEATSMGCSMGYSEEIQSKILHRDHVDAEELPGLLFGRRGYPYPRKSSRRERPSCQLAFRQLEMVYLVACLPYVRTAFPIATTRLVQLSPNPGQSIRTFSHAVPKRCQWKIDVRIRASSRWQNDSDAGPKSFELRFFLQGLRQKQHGWGAAWGIKFRRDSVKDLASRPCWHRRAPRAIVWKTWLSLPTEK